MALVPDRFDLLAQATKKRVHVVSLGCPKNRVDSELMIGLMQKDGYLLTDSPEDADLIVVNTCAFIESAKVESIDTILEMARFKERGVGRAEKLVVTGCMAQRYGTELSAEMPEVDYFLGTNEFKRINEALSGALPEREYISYGSALYTSTEDRVNRRSARVATGSAASASSRRFAASRSRVRWRMWCARRSSLALQA